LKRTSRVFLLGGIILAIIVFVLIILLFSNGTSGTGATNNPQPVTQLDTVYATVDIPLGTQVTSAMVGTHKVDVATRPPTAFANVSEVVGQIMRAQVSANTDLSAAMFTSSGIVASVSPLLDKGQRAMSIQVDQITGVGTLIQTGDHVDVIIGFGGGTYGSQPVPELCGTGFVETTVDPKTGLVTNTPSTSATVKMIVQNTKVVGTLLPPPPTTPAASTNGTTTTAPTGTSLNGQQEIVLLSVTAQQAEVIRYGQIDGCLSLVLRSPKDYVDGATPPNPVVPPLDPTTGVILKTLVDQYGVLPPQIIRAILPK
jgi:Flp pilus assembly protein CpaB